MDNRIVNSRTYNRRDFIRSTVLGSAVGCLTGCSTLDRLFGLEKSVFDREVLIVGGGAAGLAAAYELKKAGVPYRLYEASPRIGGRVYSLENFSDKQCVELGAELFETEHKVVLDLCKELNLPVDEVKNESLFDSQLSFVRGRSMLSRELAPQLQKIVTEIIRTKLLIVEDSNEVVSANNIHSFSKAIPFTKLSIAQYLQTLEGKVDKDILDLFKTSCVIQFGRSAEDVSVFHLINSFDLEASSKKTFFRIRNGNQRLLRALYERVSGVLPDFYVKVNSPLVEINESGERIQCYFQTANGRQKVEARFVILTLPANQYRSLQGLTEMKIHPARLQSLGYLNLATHSKMALEFKSRFWKNRSPGQSEFSGALLKSNWPVLTWDSTQDLTTGRGYLSVLAAGAVGEKAGADFAEDVLREFSVFNRNLRGEINGPSQVLNWSNKAYINGSFVVYRPEEFTQYHGVWEGPDYQGRLCYAGEHCHVTRYGTLAGALETGQKAAREILDLQEKKFKMISRG